MDLQLQGFNPVISVGFILLLLVITVAVSWYGYSNLSSVGRTKKWTLITLRASALSLLIILLLNPFIRFGETLTHRPEVAVYLDDTKSLDISRGGYEGVEDYRAIISQFAFDSMNDIRFSFYRFDDAISFLESPVPVLSGGVTNLDEVMRHIRDHSSDAVAALLFSDGIVTRGRDPLFTAGELSIPLFTVPVGDTTAIRDIMISDVLTDDTGYTNTAHSVDITVRQNGFAGSSVTVSLTEDGSVLDTRNLDFTSGSSVHSLNFTVEFEEAGLRNFDIQVTRGEEEESVENNHYPFTVDVLDDKTHIVHLAFDIHPDVGAVRTLLATDESIELSTGTWVGGKFSETGVLHSADEPAELLILHGPVPDDIQLSDYVSDDVPVVHFVTPALSVQEFHGLTIPLTVTGQPGVANIGLNLHESIETRSILDPEAYRVLRYPLLQVLNAEYGIPVTATVLVSGVFQGVETGLPIVLTDEPGNRRLSEVIAYGWFRLLQSESEEVREFARSMLSNLVSWTAMDPDQRNLQFQPVQRQFGETENIRFLARLSDDTGEAENDAAVEVVLSDEAGESENFTMRSSGNGNYELSVGRRPSGNYSYEATARVSGRETGSVSGGITVTESTIEYLETRRNDQLLEELAEISGGIILDQRARVQFLDELTDRGLLSPVIEERTRFRYFHDSLIWFIAVLLLLSAEWIMRRRLSLP